eukprot:3466339-Prymnesium_polylepis.4
MKARPPSAIPMVVAESPALSQGLHLDPPIQGNFSCCKQARKGRESHSRRIGSFEWQRLRSQRTSVASAARGVARCVTAKAERFARVAPAHDHGSGALAPVACCGRNRCERRSRCGAIGHGNGRRLMSICARSTVHDACIPLARNVPLEVLKLADTVRDLRSRGEAVGG